MPAHMSSPDTANPLAPVLSVALLCRYRLDAPRAADAIEKAVDRVLGRGIRTGDIAPTEGEGEVEIVGTEAMGQYVLEELEATDG